ncbi:MAG: hypothetical protein HUJ51_06835 [Eggerthellaceae bacterium]|nr:hypothetical protein [Eggerthellaceae bacterium]
MEKDFTWSRSAEQYVDLYKRICPWRVEEIERAKAEKAVRDKEEAKLNEDSERLAKKSALKKATSKKVAPKKATEKKPTPRKSTKNSAAKIVKKPASKLKGASYKPNASASRKKAKQDAVNERIAQIVMQSKKK